MHGDKTQLPPMSHQGLMYLSLLPDAAANSKRQSADLEKLMNVVVDVDLLFYVHGKHLRSCRGGQLTLPHFSWAGLDLLSG